MTLIHCLLLHECIGWAGCLLRPFISQGIKKLLALDSRRTSFLQGSVNTVCACGWGSVWDIFCSRDADGIPRGVMLVRVMAPRSHHLPGCDSPRDQVLIGLPVWNHLPDSGCVHLPKLQSPPAVVPRPELWHCCIDLWDNLGLLSVAETSWSRKSFTSS